MKDLDKLSKRILVASALLIGFSFLSPLIFTSKVISVADFSNTGAIGDTIGGIMNPFIALAGVLLTFLAFYIQFQANKQQRDDFTDELKLQKEQFQKDQFENQFYQMLQIHKENVNSIEVTQEYVANKTTNFEKVNGRRVFDYLLVELKMAMYFAKGHFPDDDLQVWINEAYGVFFHGISQKQNDSHTFFHGAMMSSEVFSGSHHVGAIDFFEPYMKLKELDGDLLRPFPRYPLFQGHSFQLSHYYRHLFHTVKFIARQDEKLISYEQKRNYIRMLRAQLSNSEQTMLFYNWRSEFGVQWENDTNKFFTDYRMIHNIYDDLLFENDTLEEIEEFDRDFRKEKDREFDPLFEFQDWLY